MIERVASRAVEVAGVGFGRGAGVLGSAVEMPVRMLTTSRRVDPDVGRLGPLPFAEARHLPAPDGGHLFTLTHGTGAPVLFVHGIATTSRIWTKQFRDLPTTGIRAVAFDQRGHGGSPAGPGASLDHLADDVRTVVEAGDLQGALAVGHSTGGMALLAFAVRHPEVAAARLRGIVLVSTAARLGLAHVPMLDRAFLPFASGFVRSGAWARSDWSRLMARLAFGRDPVRSQVELVRVLLASAPEATVAAAARALATFDCTEHLGRVGLPVLVVNGTADLCVTPGDARRLARGLPDARLELVAGAGHMLMLERADRLAELLRAFARDVGIAADVAA